MNRQVFSIINPTSPKAITFARAFPITRKMLSEAESALSFLIEKYHILRALSTFW